MMITLGLVFGMGIDTITKDMTSGIQYLADVVIPNSVVAIADEAFADCTELLSIVIPDSITFNKYNNPK